MLAASLAAGERMASEEDGAAAEALAHAVDRVQRLAA
jgi:hypothetical protein